MNILDKFYFMLLTNVSNINVGGIKHYATTSDSGTPDFTPLVDYVIGYGGAILSAILGIITLWLTFNIVKIGFKIAAASRDGDVEGRSQAIKEVGWQLLAFGLCFSSSVASGVFAGIWLNK